MRTSYPLYREPAERIHGLDFLRGLCVILMMFDHFSYDIMCLPMWSNNFNKVAPEFLQNLSDWVYDTWWEGTLRLCLRLTVICIFFTLSGISSSFSHNNTFRGIKLGIASVVLSLFTTIADKLFALDITIIFGVLHCLTVCILLYALLSFLCKDKALYACIGLGILLFIWGLLLDFYNLQLNPNTNLTGKEIGFLDFLRLMIGTRYYGADCFGLMPYGGFFLLGAGGGMLLYTKCKPYLPLFTKKPFRPVCFVGRKAVWFYLLHQPVIMLITVLVCMLMGIRFF